MAQEETQEFRVQFVPNPNIGYQHVNLFKVARIDDEYAIGAFEIDIPVVADQGKLRKQQLANAQGAGQVEPLSLHGMFRVGLVMNRTAFQRLIHEALTLALKVDIDVDKLVTNARAAVAGGTRAAPEENEP